MTISLEQNSLAFLKGSLSTYEAELKRLQSGEPGTYFLFGIDPKKEMKYIESVIKSLKKRIKEIESKEK